MLRRNGLMKRFMTLLVAAALTLCMSTASAHAAGVVESSDAGYQKDVIGSGIPVILEFYATWCPACKKTAPTVDEIAKDLDGKVKVVKINKDVNPKTTAMYPVKSIPTFFYIEKGKVVRSVKGGYPKDKLLAKLGLGLDGAPKPVAQDELVEADDRSYEEEVVNATMPVLLQFYDMNSGDSKKAVPVMRAIASELAGKVKVVSMNRARSNNTAILFGVKSLPTYFYLVKGEIKSIATGALTKDELMEKLGLAVKPGA